MSNNNKIHEKKTRLCVTRSLSVVVPRNWRQKEGFKLYVGCMHRNGGGRGEAGGDVRIHDFDAQCNGA